jgi:lambda family phage tail tape measure protein
MATKIGGVLIDVAADVSKLVEGMTKAQQTVDKTVSNIKSSLGPLAGIISGIVSVSAMKDIINTADAMGEQAQKLALSSEAWSKYAYIAKFAGVEISTLESGFSKLIANVNDFNRDGGGGAAKAFEELGISASFAKENFTSTEKTFDIIVSKLQSMDDGYKKTALVQEIFGKGAGDLVRYTDLGADGIERLGKQAQITGNIISQDFANSAGELNDGLDTLGSISTGVGNKIMTVFTPALVEASRAVSNFLNIQREMSAFELKQEIKEVEDSLRELNQLAKTRPDLAITYNAEASSQSNKLGILKKQLEDINKSEVQKSANLKKLAEEKSKIEDEFNQKYKNIEIDKYEKEKRILNQKKQDYLSTSLSKVEIEEWYSSEIKKISERENKDNDNLVNAKKHADEKSKIEEDFNNKYKQATMSKYDYSVSLLDAEKQKHLNNKMSAVKVEEWYQSEIKRLNDEKVKDEEEKNNVILENQKQFDSEYNRTILNKFEYERTLLDQQVLDWKKQGQDEIKIKEMYSAKSKEIAADEAEYFKRTEQEKREASNDWHMGMEDAIKDYQDRVNDNYAQSRMFFERTLDGMTDSLATFVVEGKASFSEFARSLGADLAKIVIQKQLAGIAGNIFDNAGTTSFFGNIFASANGNVFDGGHDVAFATGGVVGSPTYFPMSNGKTGLMGEAGPEAIIPLSRIGNDLGVKSVPSNVVLNIQNNTSSEITADKISELTQINQNGETEKVLTIVMNGVSRNTMGIRDIIKGTR